MRGINLFTIPAGAAFADELARGVLKRYGAGDPFALSRALILVPTRRAIRTLGEAFARVSAGGVAVLPRMRALGDFDETPSPLDDPAAYDVAADVVPDMPPPLPVLRREFLLTKLIQRWALNAAKDEERSALGATTPALALKLARELAVLLDQATAEGLAWEKLKTIVPENLSLHWEQTVQFLSILTEQWPALLAAEKASDPAMHRDAALRLAAQRWAAAPPSFPVIAAGSTGSVPATAELLRTIAYMPNGAVVLPGIDLGLDREAWEAAESGHPQHGMQQLLEKLDATRLDVELWGEGGDPRAARTRLIAEALRPAETTPAWRDFVHDQRGAVEGGLRGMSMFVARTPSEEALAIACALRAAVEVPGKTAALVTPDRNLARRVASELKRWGIAIDDSGGVPLSHTVVGRFLSLIVDAAADAFAPVPLLALLKHPLAALNFPRRAEARLLALKLEEKALRGPRPAAGLGGLRDLVGDAPDLVKLISHLQIGYGPFAEIMTEGRHDVTVLAQRHREAAELLSMDEASVAELWTGDAGEIADGLFTRVGEAAAEVGLVMDGREYASFIRAVMDTVPVRPKFGRHARLSILGPLEVRLQHPDLMILGSLNEGVWPPATDPGPWLNRPMRRELEVSQPERRVGLSAHDFAQAAAAPEVVLTRAEKDGGAPTTPSRWLTRLTMLVDGAGFGERLGDERWLDVARALDRPAGLPQPVEPPEPRPPVAARPRKLPVTQIERWLRDPYSLYARQILRLKPLDAIDEAPGAADRGTKIHDALDKFVKAYPKDLPSDDDEAFRALIEHGREAFGDLLQRPGVRGFWWPRFERIARWFIGFERDRRAGAVSIMAEQKGEMTFDAPGGPFTLTATADRIELWPGDAIVVADYKTGGVPSSKQVIAGFSPQLTLEAAIALGGGFPGITARTVDGLIYVALKGGAVAGEVKRVKFEDLTPDEEVERARAGLQKFVAEFDSPDMPYHSKPRVLLERYAGDYDHLARVKEWSSGDEE
ncbi:MAG: double-strand break repair protein AddB [Alphaproteobacteria bacterium]|nr:double-strand break repair protein AddB [Alphaproteobacteria bacterium]